MKKTLKYVFENVQIFERQMAYEREVSKQMKLETEKARAEADKKQAEVERWRQQAFRRQMKWTTQLNAYLQFLGSSKLVKYSKEDKPGVFGDYDVSMNRRILAEGQTWHEPMIWWEDAFLASGRYFLKIAFEGKRREDTPEVFGNIVKTHFDQKDIPFSVGRVEVVYNRDLARNVAVLELIPKQLAKEYQRISRV